MEDSFIVPILYNGKEYNFEASLVKFGFTYRIQVTIEGVEVLFEPDEERNYRVMLADPDSAQKLDTGLVEAVLREIESIK